MHPGGLRPGTFLGGEVFEHIKGLAHRGRSCLCSLDTQCMG